MNYERDGRDAAADRFAAQREVVRGVIERYARVCELPPISGTALDDEGSIVRKPLLAPGTIALLYKMDVEAVTTRALEGEHELQAAWFAIALDEPVKTHVEKRLVRKLASVYEPLRSSNYFRPSHRVGCVEGATCTD